MRVLITGANGGLGPAVVDEFLSRGDTVVAVARSWRESDPRVTHLSADLTQPEDARRMAAEAGDVDVLVHVVGGFAGLKPLAETDDSTWDQMMNVNARSAFLAIRAVLPGMVSRGHGRIVAVGSRVGTEPVATLSAYGASKAALVHLIRTLGLEVKDTGITANIVMPSTIDTDVNRRMMPDADHSKWVAPASIAKVVSWLASDSAADVNGAVVPVYGRA